MNARILVASLSLVALAACGGGGSSAGGGGAIPPAPPVATNAPVPSSLTGRVVTLAGSLSAAGSAPAPSATLAPGAPVAGATVYVIPNGANVAGIPTAPLAIATTAADGSFSVAVASNVTTYGVVVVNGSTVNANGTTERGFTLAHGAATPGLATTFYLDTLTQDEQSAFSALNAKRAAAALRSVSSDTVAQAAARRSVAQRPGMATCDAAPGSSQAYAALGGNAPNGAPFWTDTAGPSWNAIIDYMSPWNDATVSLAGFAAIYNGAPCGTGFVGPVNYFVGVYVR